MLQSTHYNLNLAEGTDLVNPLTIDVPNYQTIDSTMYANEQSGIGNATELKSGSIHAITRTAPVRNVFRFTATSIFNLGDTFTVDGNTVTALYPDQSSLKDRCFIVGSEVLCMLTGSQLTVLATFLQSATEVPFDDTDVPYTATNVQDAIEHASTASGTEFSSGVSVADKISWVSLGTLLNGSGSIDVGNYTELLFIPLINGSNKYNPVFTLKSELSCFLSVYQDSSYNWSGKITLVGATLTYSQQSINGWNSCDVKVYGRK